MTHELGFSGSTIMSNPNQFARLFNARFKHVEIGEFPTYIDFESFLQLSREKGYRYGIHSPLIRGESKYDLLDFISFEPEQARLQFEDEVRTLSQLGAAYVLVHFPFIKDSSSQDIIERVKEGLSFLNRLQENYKILIVCEPKLGPSMSPHNIEILHDFPKQLWEAYGLSLCIDIGDYLLAVGEEWPVYLKQLQPFIKVVHLHNILIEGAKYIWVPPHPALEESNEYFRIKPIVEYLARGQAKYFIFEHTPHSNPSDQFVNESISWIESLLHV
ncbi:TIM barrel protein [Halobacillus naozhouensis]|uniref:TIM barrel protein n=1 Tax=Halobacillus naozhouensis TaxID=554880 RepID=A0ABY8IVY2_9BACI|nr:TIM barrel protein [Halobacillus naozhouensis]WFT73344.1 TIM barrel protein [Halobacillus naozhouensis]